MNEENEVPHPFADLINLEVTGREDGSCTTELAIQEKHANPHGVVHGAVIYALADTGMGGALTSTLDEGQWCSTIEIKINYFRPGQSGRLVCRTRILNRGRRTAAMLSEVFNDANQCIATATGTFMINAQ